MIVFELLCSKRHRFEGWFASSDAFERQSAQGLVACPVCASAEVRKVPSAKVTRPRAAPQPSEAEAKRVADARPQERSEAPAAGGAATKQMALAAFIDQVLANSEDVGTRFAEEARRIHYGEAAKRSIRGQASPEETEALLDEGIPVVPLPIPPKDDWQ